MPKLSELGNSDAVDSAFAARTIIYVEANADSDVFARIVGMSAMRRLDFKAPLADGGGYSAVCAQVKAERAAGNPRVFGLVDGEAAASLGGLPQLVSASNAIFPLPNYDGIFCLAEHELENLMVQHGDICRHLLKDVELAKLSSRSLPDIEKTLKDLTRRFFVAAILKYAALNLRHHGQLYHPVNVERFQDPKANLKTILGALKAIIVSAGLDWKVFVRQVFEITRSLRQRLRDEGASDLQRDLHLLRLADGKGLLKRMRSDYKASKGMEGHLVSGLVNSAYAGIFRQEILTAVAA